jgi:hypothetical protein
MTRVVVENAASRGNGSEGSVQRGRQVSVSKIERGRGLSICFSKAFVDLIAGDLV